MSGINAATDPCIEVTSRPILIERCLTLCPPKFNRNIDVIGELTIMDKPLGSRLD